MKSVPPAGKASCQKPSLQKPLARSAWWALFLLATYVMSLWFQTFKAFTLVPSWQNASVWLGVMLVLVMLVLVLVYDSYVQEKANARVQKPIQLFETLYRKRFLIRKDLQQKELME
jgi:hypothetical protein